MSYFLAAFIPFLLTTIILRILDHTETNKREALRIKVEKDVNTER